MNDVDQWMQRVGAKLACPRCGSCYYGSSAPFAGGPLTRHCHGVHEDGGCGFSWPHEDDRLYFYDSDGRRFGDPEPETQLDLDAKKGRLTAAVLR